MSEHYYSKVPHSEMKTETIEYDIRDEKFTVTTSSGVFSKKGLDFGTRVLIDLFQMPQVAGDILDLGCGYGPIGMFIGRRYPKRKVDMVDINERAIALSKKNAKANQIDNLNIYQSDGFENVQQANFAAIITNPPIRTGKENIYQMFEKSYELLVDGGELWIVIQKKQGAPSARKFLGTMFKIVEVVGKRKGYYVIKAIKKSS